MKRVFMSISAATAMLLSGCASDPVNLHYYLLHSPSKVVKKEQRAATAHIRFNRIALPDYLKQRGLAMQTGPATVFFSSSHVWAEPLASGLVQSLSESLWQEQHIDVIPNGVYEHLTVHDVAIHVDDLIATNNNEVVLKGHFWLYPATAEPVMQRFDYRRELTADGFEHAVINMRELVTLLAADVAKSVSDVK